MRVVTISESIELAENIQKCINLILQEGKSKDSKEYKSESITVNTLSSDIGKDGFLKQKIDIAFVGCSAIQKYKVAERIKARHPASLVIAVSEAENGGISLGEAGVVDDFIGFDTVSSEYFPLKFALWFALAELREHDVGFSSDHKNAINVRVWNRKTIFQLEDESSLGLIWEFFINDKRFDLIPYANNWIQACYSICLRILESGYTSTVVFDENDTTYMLTVSSLPIGKKSFYDELVAHAQLDKLRFISHMHKKAKGVFSLLLLKNLSFDDDMAHGKKPDERDAKQQKSTAKNTEGSSYVPLKNPSMSKDPAREYVKECGIEEEDLVEIRALESELRDDLAETEDLFKQLRIYGRYFVDFANAIKMLIEFEDLQQIMEDIGGVMLSIENVKNIDKSVFFADMIRQDLSLWFSHVFILQDAQNVHYLDASLASSCHKIKEYLIPEHNVKVDDDDDLELF